MEPFLPGEKSFTGERQKSDLDKSSSGKGDLSVKESSRKHSVRFSSDTKSEPNENSDSITESVIDLSKLLPSDPIKRQLYQFFRDDQYANQTCADCRCNLKNNEGFVFCSYRYNRVRKFKYFSGRKVKKNRNAGRFLHYDSNLGSSDEEEEDRALERITSARNVIRGQQSAMTVGTALSLGDSFGHESLNNLLPDNPGAFPSSVRLIKFKEAHTVFAPPWAPSGRTSRTSRKKKVAYPQHAVFICNACSLVHNGLGTEITTVKALASNSWTESELEFILSSGGNKYASEIYERYLLPHWKKRIPSAASTLSDRELFITSKYNALAFTFPTNLLQGNSWSNLLQKRILSAEKKTVQQVVYRLVDFFCIVGPTKNVEKDVEKKGHVKLETAVLAQYPQEYPDLKVPTELHKYIFPNGCRPSKNRKAPNFFTFLLTNEVGAKMYGSCLQVYDESFDMTQILRMVRQAGFEGSLAPANNRANIKGAPQTLHLPKSLVLLSHYPFYNTWRKFLTTIYRISRFKSHVPLERWIANFVSEVPLPPQGRIEIKYSPLPKEPPIIISRPRKNELPLADFSYRPLFTCLSVSNVLVVFGCLLQEARVVLCSQHISLLGPTSEALLSLLFPFSWQGCNVPILPFNMLDILDAPVPLLVGIHSRYLTDVSPESRPAGVVFVDLDNDIVHLGFEEGTNSLTSYPKAVPPLPKEVSKLQKTLDDCASSVYVPPPENIKGRLTTGNENAFENKLRETYAQEQEVKKEKAVQNSAMRRLFILSRAEKAFPNDEYMIDVELVSTLESGITIQKKVADNSNDTEHQEKKSNNISLLDSDYDEANNFSAKQIREGFLRFFLVVMKSYEKHIGDLNGETDFRTDDFLKDIQDESIRSFMANFCKTQIFSAFRTERIASPDRPEWRFFDESIVAIKNKYKRKKLGPRKVNKGTPFLDDMSDKITEEFSPPQPSTTGLPSFQPYFQYSKFPFTMKNHLFGKIREVKSFHLDASTNDGSRADSHPELLLQDMVLQSLMFPYSFEEIPDRNLEWAVYVMAYRSIGMNHGNADRKMRISKLLLSMLPTAHKFISEARNKQGFYYWGISKAHGSYKKKFDEKIFHIARQAARTLQHVFRTKVLQAKYAAKDGLCSLYAPAVAIQSLFRGFKVRKKYRWMRAQIILLQSIAKGLIARIRVKKRMNLAAKIQSLYRMSKCVYYYGIVRSLVVMVQNQYRGFRDRKRVHNLRKERLLKYRAQIFELWRRCFTPLLYRSKFWLYINKSGYLYLGIHEEELKKLWKILRIESKHNSLFVKFVEVQAKLDSFKNNDPTATLSPLFPAERDVNLRIKLDNAKDDLLYERNVLYEKLKHETPSDKQQKFYKSFNIDNSEKLKKARLTEYLWEIRKLAKASAKFVIEMRQYDKPMLKRAFSPCPGNYSSYLEARIMEDEAMATFVKNKYDGMIKRAAAISLQSAMVAMHNLGQYEIEHPNVRKPNIVMKKFKFQGQEWEMRRIFVEKYLACTLFEYDSNDSLFKSYINMQNSILS